MFKFYHKKNSFLTLYQRYRNSNEKMIEQILGRWYKKNQLLDGYCDKEGTQTFSKINRKINNDHWKTPQYIKDNIKISSIGIGTQRGDLDVGTDRKLFEVLLQGIKNGKINTIDTDINFRYGKSQKIINSVIHYLHHQHHIHRNCIFIATKCGYIPNDADSNLDQQAFIKMMVDEQKYFNRDQIVNQIHCLHPNFIQFCVEKSRLSLGISTIDLLYLNNPTQSQQTVIGKKKYFERLQKAFERLEQLRGLNQIRNYGIASFLSFRSPPTQQLIHVQLNQLIQLAQKVGGQNHGLRYILAPFNLYMPEILQKWQKSQQNKLVDLFQIASQCKVNVNICCPFFQGKLAQVPFSSKWKHIQFVRSLPKLKTLSTYFGTLNVEHLQQILEVAQFPLMSIQELKEIRRPSSQSSQK